MNNITSRIIGQLMFWYRELQTFFHITSFQTLYSKVGFRLKNKYELDQLSNNKIQE